MTIHLIASAAYNSINAGLSGYESSLNVSLELLEDEVINTRLEIIKKYAAKNLAPKKDLYQSINCIEIDCKSLDKCCLFDKYQQSLLHFEIPQLVNDLGDDAIAYIGATNKHNSFKVYTNTNFTSHKYKMRGNKKPFVYIDTTPNENNLYDVYLFNLNMLERISVIGVWKNPNLLDLPQFKCCNLPHSEDEISNISWIDQEIIDTVSKRYIQYYRLLYSQPQPNDQTPR